MKKKLMLFVIAIVLAFGMTACLTVVPSGDGDIPAVENVFDEATVFTGGVNQSIMYYGARVEFFTDGTVELVLSNNAGRYTYDGTYELMAGEDMLDPHSIVVEYYPYEMDGHVVNMDAHVAEAVVLELEYDVTGFVNGFKPILYGSAPGMGNAVTGDGMLLVKNGPHADVPVATGVLESEYVGSVAYAGAGGGLSYLSAHISFFNDGSVVAESLFINPMMGSSSIVFKGTFEEVDGEVVTVVVTQGDAEIVLTCVHARSYVGFKPMTSVGMPAGGANGLQLFLL